MSIYRIFWEGGGRGLAWLAFWWGWSAGWCCALSSHKFLKKAKERFDHGNHDFPERRRC